MSTDEGPFFFGAVNERLRESHFRDGDGGAVVNAEATEWLKREDVSSRRTGRERGNGKKSSGKGDLRGYRRL